MYIEVRLDGIEAKIKDLNDKVDYLIKHLVHIKPIRPLNDSEKEHNLRFDAKMDDDVSEPRKFRKCRKCKGKLKGREEKARSVCESCFNKDIHR